MQEWHKGEVKKMQQGLAVPQSDVKLHSNTEIQALAHSSICNPLQQSTLTWGLSYYGDEHGINVYI